MMWWLEKWVRLCAEHARLTLSGIALLTVLLGWAAVNLFHMNSDLSQLIRQDTDWRQDFDRFEAEFPDLVHTAVVVVSGETRSAVLAAGEQIVAALEQHPEHFRAVYAPGGGEFFRRHGLLYLAEDELQTLVDRLARAQPLLTSVVDDPNLAGVAQALQLGLESDAAEQLTSVMEALADSAEAYLEGQPARVDWSRELQGGDATFHQLIFLKANSSFDTPVPDAQVMTQLRTLLSDMDFQDGVHVAITGEIALQHEEIEAAIAGVSLAGWLALALLLVVMWVGVRCARIIGATFLLLGIGMVWTCGLAMLVVGEFNTLSIVFLIMFFGLGVDFALHFSLRLQESAGPSMQDNLAAAVHSVGRAITLCTLTTAIAFLCFVPTAYAGLGDLGVISAMGMCVAWLLTFTLLPAFFFLSGPPRQVNLVLPTSERWVRRMVANRHLVVLITVLVGGVAIWGTSLARFDYSVLALKDPDSLSMRTLRDLQKHGLSNDYQLVVVDDGPVAKSMLSELEEVGSVRTVGDLVPEQQAAKLAILDDLGFMFWDLLMAEPLTVQPSTELVLALTELRDLCLQADTDAAGRLGRALGTLLSAHEQHSQEFLAEWEHVVLGGLLQEINLLRDSLQAGGFDFEQLPEPMRRAWLSPAGSQLSAITPSEDIADIDRLSAFVEAVRSVYPQATGRPVVEWGVGAIVLQSFQMALLYAMGCISAVLLIALRRLGAVAVVLLPLALAGTLSLALGVWFDQPINMANILVVPLIFGLGVDNGIHVVERYLGEGDVDQLMHSSTPRAVLLSTLTTIGAFAALSLSPHMGTASIGFLLSTAVALVLLFTMFLLPVLLSYLPAPARPRPDGAGY